MPDTVGTNAATRMPESTAAGFVFSPIKLFTTQTMAQKTFKGRPNLEDNIVLPFSKVNNSYLIKGLTSEDSLTLDATLLPDAVNYAHFVTAVVRNADLIMNVVNIRSGKTVSTITMEGAARSSGLETLTIEMNQGSVSWALRRDVDHNEYRTDAFLIAGTVAGGSLQGTPFDDRIHGSSAAEIIEGLEGDDLIFCGGGNDTLTGGAGEDTFEFAALSDFFAKKIIYDKTITDFNPVEDFIRLSNIGKSTALKFSQTATVSNWKKGTLIYVTEGESGTLLGNIDADRDAEIVIHLTGISKLDMSSIGV